MGDQIATFDCKKAGFLLSAFFIAMPKIWNDCLCSVDITWRAHRLHGAPDSVDVTPHEETVTIRRTRVGVALGQDGIPTRVFWKYMLIIFLGL